MTEAGYILDVPLPLNQDFNALKEKGLAYIQLHSDYRWTNLNASDPGVTILDQICYALTELGYCNDFPVRDILARKDGKIQIYDQFYLPDAIFTTSPVAVTDYVKYVIDGVTNVNNAVFLRNRNATLAAPVYSTYLLIDPSVSTQPDSSGSTPQDYVCDAAFVYLNRARNLCELFAIPLPLKTAGYGLTGQIEIENADELGTILEQINESISNYIFPPVIPRSYKQLLAGSETMETIFDGPRLKNGWISTDMLGTKKDDVTIYEIIQLIEVIPGVISVDELYFSGPTPEKLHCEKNELLVINATASYKDKSLLFVSNNTTINADTFTPLSTTTSNAPDFESNILFGAGIDIRTDLPKAVYRDINSYYSIQNTFPDIYPVGPEFVDSNAAEYQIAQSRQLMGYLTLFDQVLANQFSQLANVEQLFSFKNAMTATPSDRRWYYAVKEQYHERGSMYPVPYTRFSPTYFFQSVYDTPGIKPVLRGNETFDFHSRPISEDKAEKIEWHRFRLDPYNPYIRGLMNIMENEAESLRRRNRMLDHLLARHGESSLLINAYINGSVYTNEANKDKVIFKSLYLQNLGLLSYNRYKAYNYLQADPFVKMYRTGEYKETREVLEIRAEFRKWILPAITADEDAQLEEMISVWASYYSERLMKWILLGNTVDSIFDSEKVNELEKVLPDEFRNYSGIELKLSLLFGLKVLYRNLIVTGEKEDTSGETPVLVPEYSNGVKLQSLWLISRRKGLLLIEMCLLQQCLQFDLFFVDGNTQWQLDHSLTYAEAVALENVLKNNSSTNDSVQMYSTFSQLKAGGVTYTMNVLTGEAETQGPFQAVNGTNFSFALRVRNSQIDVAQVSTLSDGPLFIFPDYVPMFQTYAFYARLKLLLDNELPVNAQYGLHYGSYDVLTQLIPAFTAWHDSLMYDSLGNYALTNSLAQATTLLEQILQTQLLPYSAA